MFFPIKEYKDWNTALNKSTGYHAPVILEKVYEAESRVRRGEAVYQRDSVLFENIQYSWPVLSALMWVAAQSDGELDIIDFGGSLGTSYRQNKKFFSALKRVRWNIVEQKHFVELGKREFENESLRFYFDLDSCLRENKVSAILFSGVLQYLEKPFAILEKVKSSGIKFIIIDRTSFQKVDKDKIVLQKVPKSIYKASYPFWIFSESKFGHFFKNDVIIETFRGFKENVKDHIMFKGYIIQLGNSQC